MTNAVNVEDGDSKQQLDTRRSGDSGSMAAAQSALILARAALEGLEDLATGHLLDETELEQALTFSPA